MGLVCPYSFDRPGGVQNHVLGLAQHLHEAGHEPSVLAPGDLPPDARLHPDRFVTAGSSVPVRYNGSVARVSFGPLVAARVRRWLRAGRFDVVHVHEPVTPSVALLALWYAEQPVLATSHTATPRSRGLQLAGSTLRASIDKINGWVAVSESARSVVVDHLGRDAAVIPNGFTYADFAAPAPARRTAGTRWRGGHRPRLVFLGRSGEPRKGLDVLLAAAPQIRGAFPDLEILVAGEGSRHLPTGCTGLGLVSDPEKAALLRGADLFVAPHRDRESFGIVLLEAMASGAAVVAADLPPFVQLLGDPGTNGDSAALGALFPAGDPVALAAAAIATLQRPDPARTARAQEVARRYDWSVVGPEIEGAYDAILADRRRVPEYAG